jgi:hypothetical protein
MYGSVNVPFLPKAGKYGIAGKISQSEPPNPENGRLPATGVRWINCVRRAPGIGKAAPERAYRVHNERPLPIAARGGVKVSCGA